MEVVQTTIEDAVAARLAAGGDIKEYSNTYLMYYYVWNDQGKWWFVAGDYIDEGLELLFQQPVFVKSSWYDRHGHLKCEVRVGNAYIGPVVWAQRHTMWYVHVPR